MDAVERDVRSGMPAAEVAQRYRFLNDQYDAEKLAAHLRMLRRAGVGPFRLLGDDPPAPDDPAAAEKERNYRRLVDQVRQVVGKAVPPDATVLVVSHGDWDLLQLGARRRGWHFPRVAGGTAYGHKPADGAEAVAHLEALRAEGAQFLLFPEPAFWWLEAEEYQEFKRHLEKRYPVRVNRKDVCIVFDLR
jgi:hypothetical protein